MAKIKFTKMNGLGNDFVVLDYVEYQKSGMEKAELAAKLCDRHFGIGADGLMVVDAPTQGGDYKMLFFNSDGSVGVMPISVGISIIQTVPSLKCAETESDVLQNMLGRKDWLTKMSSALIRSRV